MRAPNLERSIPLQKALLFFEETFSNFEDFSIKFRGEIFNSNEALKEGGPSKEDQGRSKGE